MSEKSSLHGLRHVYASMLASSGQVDMFTLQRLLTHKSPAMTKRYAHLRDEALRSAAELAGNLMDQTITGKYYLEAFSAPSLLPFPTVWLQKTLGKESLHPLILLT